MNNRILKNLNLFIFAKDKNLRYLYCNEAMAEAAGIDSPSQVKKKTDHDLCWRKHADFYNEGDRLVLNGGIRINAPEIQTQPTKIANILVTKTLLKNKNDETIGVVGYYIDITGQILQKTNGHFDCQNNKFYLGSNLNNEYLTRKEVYIFKCILLGWGIQKIAAAICRSEKTIESHIAKIKHKLQCDTKSEIAPRAIELGLTYILQYPDVENKKLYKEQEKP